MRVLRLLCLCAFAALSTFGLSACDTALGDFIVEVAPAAVGPAQELIAGAIGMTPQEQCDTLNTIRTLYPDSLDEAVDELGTKSFICVAPDGEVLLAAAEPG